MKNIILDVGGIFFDDSQKNIDAAIKEGIKSIKFYSLNDIEEFIKRSE